MGGHGASVRLRGAAAPVTLDALAKEVIVVSELGGSQISTLLETLPGIANVLRSPVADALGNIIRSASRLSEFNVADADELVKYATRRGLLGQDEGDRLLQGGHPAGQGRGGGGARS